MTATELLADFDRLGVRLEAHGDRLRFYPASVLTSAHVAALREHKAAILATITKPKLQPLVHLEGRPVIGCGFPPRPIPSVDPKVVAAPRIPCPSCARGTILPELAKMTKGLCYPCWRAQV